MGDSNTKYFKDKLMAIGIHVTEISLICTAINETCPYCWEGEHDCQCWNDD